jgi:hypothetical protein
MPQNQGYKDESELRYEVNNLTGLEFHNLLKVCCERLLINKTCSVQFNIEGYVYKIISEDLSNELYS